MPIQSRDLEWDSLAALFEFRPANSGVPGDQRAGIDPWIRENQALQIRRFAAKFKGVLQEHTRQLRTRLKSAEEYRERARSWQRSVLVNSSASARFPTNMIVKARSEDGQRMTSDQAVEESTQLRQRVKQIESRWDSHRDERLIFSDGFLAKYGPLREVGGEMAEFQSLELWLHPEQAPSVQQ